MRTIILFLSFFFITSVYGQSGFRHLSSLDGLSQNDINFIFQDSKGFMWFGTVDGLNRYDGRSFVKYRRTTPMEYPIGSNLPFCMVEDSTGNFWIGTSDDGIWFFNRKKDEFHKYPFDYRGKKLFNQTKIKDLFLNDEGMLWVVTADAVVVIDTQKYHKGEYGIQIISDSTPVIGGELDFSHPNFVKGDKKGRMWIGTSKGLFLALPDPQSGIKLEYMSQMPSESCRGLIETTNGYLAYMTHGIYYCSSDVKNGKISSVNLLSSFYCNVLTCTNEGSVWAGNFNGLYEFNFNERKRQLKLVKHYQHIFNDGNSLSKNNVMALYHNRQGLLWVGTNGGGINLLNLNQKKFTHVYQTMEAGSLSYNKVRALFEDKENNLWVGTEGGGISLLDKAHRGDYDSGFRSFPISLVPSEQNNVYCFDTIPGSSSAVVFGAGYPMKLGVATLKKGGEVDIQSFSKLVANSIFTVLTDRDDYIWAGSYDGGLYRLHYNRDTKRLKLVRHYSFDPSKKNGLSSNIIRSLLLDVNGDLLIGTDNGLNILPAHQKDKVEPSFTVYRHESRNDSTLAHNYVLALFRDHKNRVWVGTMGGGLCLFNRSNDGTKGWFKSYTSADGFPNDVIKAIEEDALGNLWISSNDGLTRFNPENAEIRNYIVDDGLQDYEFSELASEKSQNGELLFGGINGFNVFRPSQIYDSPFLPKVMFTQFYVLNDLILPGEEYHGRVLLDSEMPSTSDITLKYSENSFSVNFSALNFVAPQKIKYKYMLEGFDEDWVNVLGNEPRAGYTNVPPGEYVLKVLATNNDGIWNTQPATLAIEVVPPLWRSNVALVIFFLLGIVLLIFFRKFSIIGVTKKNELLMEHFEQEKMDELVQMKLQFFTNISHEFRTPLTLIQSPLEKLIIRGEKVDESYRQRSYSLMMKNVGLLNRLVDQLMEFRKMEKGKMRLTVAKGNLIDLMKESYELFREITESKSIRFELKYEAPVMNLWFDWDKMEKVLFNLLSNAIKFTPKGGEVILSANECMIDNVEGVRIDVIDNGPGIEKEKLPFLFERFYQAVNYQLSKVSGTGIGLSFAKNLVLLHHGELKVSSVPDMGSVFSVFLRKGVDHFPQEDIVSSKIDGDEGSKANRISHLSFEKCPNNQNVTEKVNQGAPLILVVEDNMDVQSFLKETFVEEGFNCIQAFDGVEGLELCRKHFPAIVVSDVMMPNMDGFELCKKLKGDESICHIPVVMLTAKETTPDQVAGLKYGAEAYLSKPFDVQVLVAQIKSILEARRVVMNKFSKKIEIEPSEVTFTSYDEKLIKKLMKVVEDNISNPELSVSQLASEVGMSQSVLNKKLKGILGLTANTFIRNIRLKRAAQLLKLNRLSVTDVVYEVGFSDVKYFRECFRKQFGMPPSEFLKQHREVHK